MTRKQKMVAYAVIALVLLIGGTWGTGGNADRYGGNGDFSVWSDPAGGGVIGASDGSFCAFDYCN